MILLSSSACSGADSEIVSSDAPVRLQIALPERPNGAVLDEAEILPAKAETVLDGRLRRLWEDTRNALVIVTVDSLQGQPIEDYSLTLARTWGIGDESHKGLMILVAPKERKVRIEVSCGLETTITDSFASEVIETTMLPEFRDGNFAGGINAGTDALIAKLAQGTPANDASPQTDPCMAGTRKAA